MGVSSNLINYIDLSNFEENRALKNTISLNKAKVVIRKTQFINNRAVERTKNLFVGFSEVNISDCTFRSPIAANPAKSVLQDMTMGSFIFAILDVRMLI